MAAEHECSESELKSELEMTTILQKLNGFFSLVWLLQLHI